MFIRCDFQTLSEIKICNLSNIADNDAKGMVAVVEGKQRNIVVVRQGDQAYAYLNWCPHTQVLIDQIPGKFFNADHTHLVCSKHGALFRPEDGFCVSGPCEGDSLPQLKVTVKDGAVFLTE